MIEYEDVVFYQPVWWRRPWYWLRRRYSIWYMKRYTITEEIVIDENEELEMTNRPTGWFAFSKESPPQIREGGRILFGRSLPDGTWHWWMATAQTAYWWQNTPEIVGLHWAYVPEWIERGHLAA